MHWSWLCEPTAYSREIPLWIFYAWIDCGPCWAKLMEHGQSSGFHSNSTHLIRSCTSGVASAGSREHGQIKALPGLPPTSSFFLCPSLSNCYTLRNYLYQIIPTVMIISQFRQPLINSNGKNIKCINNANDSWIQYDWLLELNKFRLFYDHKM